MSSFPMDIRRQAREFVEARKPYGEVDALLDIKPGPFASGNAATCGMAPKVRIGPVTRIWTLTK
ncbi:hypothetical protein N8778_05805 [Verrucomicrobia bacterium]|nr:hypothetical protein [Verrucomicrobiota bacterium]